MIGFMGFAMIIVLIGLLLWGKTHPVPVFVTVPVVAALLCGFKVSEISGFVMTGFGSVYKICILFIFSITYFGIMQDTGMFDVVTKKLVKLSGNNLVAVTIVTAVITVLAHLDGSGASTYAIVFPAMLPIYKKLKMKKTSLLMIVCVTAGVMNFVPWGGTVARAATAINFDVTELWHIILPVQILGLVIALVLCVIIAGMEKRRGAGIYDAAEEIAEVKEETVEKPKFLVFNMLLTAALIVVLVSGVMGIQVAFMIALTIALLVNYPTAKEQGEHLKAHSSNVISIVAILVSSAALLGILSESGMIDAMVAGMIQVMPSSMANVIHLVVAVLGAPLGMIFGPDPYYYSILPLIAEVSAVQGISAVSVAIALIIGENLTCTISPVVPTSYLAYGLCELEIKDGIKKCFLPAWAISVILIVFAVVIGVVAL